MGMGVSVAVGRGVPFDFGAAEAGSEAPADNAVAVPLMFRSSSSMDVLGGAVAAGRARVAVLGRPVELADAGGEGRAGVTGVTC